MVTPEIRDKSYDICLSPLYETFDRQKDVAFSAPLYYSNIGIYVPKDFSLKWNLSNLTFADAIKKLKGIDEIMIGGVQGEISGKMAEKMIREYGISSTRKKLFEQYQSNVTDLVNLLDHRNRDCNVVFAESLHAEMAQSVTGEKVVNILKENELLYPVGFALRRSDYILKNLINLKIIEARETVNDMDKDMIFKWIEEHCGKGFPGKTIDFRKHFVTEHKIVISAPTAP